MGNIMKAVSMMLVSVIGIGIVALAIYMERPSTSVDCEEQICTTGTIAQVVDGDTVKFLSDEGEEIRIRLALINAAERTEPGGEEAKTFAESVDTLGTITRSVEDAKIMRAALLAIPLESNNIPQINEVLELLKD